MSGPLLYRSADNQNKAKLMAVKLSRFKDVFLFLIIVSIFSECPTVLSAKNVLFIIVPNYKNLCLGKSPYTPYTNLFSSECLRFQNAYSQLPSTVPSRDSLFTSRRPDSLKSYDGGGISMKGVFTSLPEYFEDNGFQTLSVGKVFPLGNHCNSSGNQSIWSHIPFWPHSAQFDNASCCICVDNKLWVRMASNLVCPIIPQLQSQSSLPDQDVSWAAKNFIRSFNKSEQNFLLAVGFFRPEVPLKFPVKYLKYNPLKLVAAPNIRIRPADMPSVAWNPANEFKNFFDMKQLNLSYPFGIVSELGTRKIIQGYLSTLTYIDDLIGELLEELIDNNLYKKTIVVIAGDHGCTLGEKGLWGGHSCYDTALKVPLLFYVPGITTRMRFRKISYDLVELVDLFPTLAELAGLPPLPRCPENLDSPLLCTEGVSLCPLLNTYATSATLNKKWYRKWKSAVFSQVPRPSECPTKLVDSDLPPVDKINIMGYAIRTLRYKYVEWVKFTELKPIWSEVLARELYDFEIDPKEILNLAAKPQLRSVVDRLSEMLHAGWRSCLPRL